MFTSQPESEKQGKEAGLTIPFKSTFPVTKHLSLSPISQSLQFPLIVPSWRLSFRCGPLRAIKRMNCSNINYVIHFLKIILVVVFWCSS